MTRRAEGTESLNEPLHGHPQGPLYLRQLCSGRDFAVDDPIARQMANYVYVVGDLAAKKVVMIDPAYAPAEIVADIESEGFEVTAVILTHYHADHAGGALGAIRIKGVVDLLSFKDVPVHVQRSELNWLMERTGIDSGSVVAHGPGETVMVGELSLDLIHTPGHTEGSQCVFAGGRLFTGDTLFLDGCGRTDLPGGDAGELFESLTNRLRAVGNDVSVFTGHAYSPHPSQSMGELRRQNPVLAPLSKERWLARFSGA